MRNRLRFFHVTSLEIGYFLCPFVVRFRAIFMSPIFLFATDLSYSPRGCSEDRLMDEQIEVLCSFSPYDGQQRSLRAVGANRIQSEKSRGLSERRSDARAQGHVM